MQTVKTLTELTPEQKEIVFNKFSIIKREYFNDDWLDETSKMIKIDLSSFDLEDFLEFLEMDICLTCGSFFTKKELSVNEDSELVCWSCRGDTDFLESNIPENTNNKMGSYDDFASKANDFFNNH